MNNKIKEVQQYFRRKIIAGNCEVTEHGQHNWNISVDDYQFNIWVANGEEYIRIKGFMIIPLNDAEKLTIWNRVVEFKRDNLKLIIEGKEQELDELKNKLS